MVHDFFDLPGIDSETIENPDRLDRREDPFFGFSHMSTILKDSNDFLNVARVCFCAKSKCA